MTTQAQVTEFIDRLESSIDRTPAGKTDPKDMRWVCGKDGDNFYFARQLAQEMGIDLVDVVAGHHVGCDCEIVFNADNIIYAFRGIA